MAILDGCLPRRAGVHRVVANPVLRPSFRALAGSHFSPQNREDLLDRAALHIAKCPFAEKDVCRGVPPG